MLSAAGKEVLIKSVAMAIPIFSMACFKLPSGLCQHINAIIRSFWWGSKDGKRKMCWVAWKEMTKSKFMGGMGFRDIELFNLALLARQGWRIMQNPTTLSARMLKAVYFPNNDFLDADLRPHPSKVWRAIMEGKAVLAQGLIRRIGTGEDTNPWNDNWLPRDGALRPYACRENAPDPPQQVSQLIIQPTRVWDVAKLNTFFLPMDAQAIQALPISTRAQADFWAWNGIFTVRSAYRMIVATKATREAWLESSATNSNHQGMQKSWTKLWSLHVPAKLKVFLWRLAKQSLPTADTLHRRHIAQSSTCSICGGEDSWRHSLIDCTMARCVWALADEGMTEHMSQVQEPAARNWLFVMMDTLPHDQLIRMCVTAWAIWHARRKVIHEGIFQSPLSTHSFVECFISELGQIPKPAEKGGRPTVKNHPKWIPSGEGIAKLNVDAGVARNMDAGVVAVVARTAAGAYLGASAVVFDGIADPEILEAMAIREGLNLASDLLLRKIHVASDCLNVIKALREKNLGRYNSVLHEISAMAKSFEEASFVHENRASNTEPHDLARAVLGFPVGRHVWFVNPPDGVCIPKNLNI